MSTQAVLPQQGIPPQVSQEPTPSAPDQTPRTKAGDAQQPVKEIQDLLLDVRRRHKQTRQQIRRNVVRRISRNFQYAKGNQYDSFDPWSFQYYNPFDQSGNDGTEQGKNDGLYAYTHNIVQWLMQVFMGTLSVQVPSTRWWPANAQNDDNVRAAQSKSHAQAYIERQNNIESLLKQELMNIFLAGSYFKHTRYIRDADRNGVEQMPVYEMGEKTFSPDRYECPNCGQETPADIDSVLGQPTCQGCGTQLGDDNFYPEEKIQVPVITSWKDVPKGKVLHTVYNGMDVDVAPSAEDSTDDPLLTTETLDLQREISVSALRAMFENAWDLFKPSQSGNGINSTEMESILRQRVYTSGMFDRLTLQAGTVATLSRCWMKPESFNILDKKEDAQKLQAEFPDGCELVSVNEKFLSVRPAKLSDEWTWCGRFKGFGAYPPAVVDPAIDFQDRLNDTANSAQAEKDRIGGGGFTLIDADTLNYKGLAGMPLAGAIIPVKIKGAQKTLQTSVYQQKFTPDQTLVPYMEYLVLAAQLLVGITPQTWGGGQQHIDTLGGQQQALQIANTIMGIYYANIREEHANAASRAVKCLANNATEEELISVVDAPDSEIGFRNETIPIQDLLAEGSAYPDSDQGYPESNAQITDRWVQLLKESGQNPLIGEMFKPRSNRRQAIMRLGTQDMKLPDEAQYKKTMKDIQACISAPPRTVLGPDNAPVILPPAEPNKYLDDLDDALSIVKEWAQDNYYSVLEPNPVALQNIINYVKLIGQFQMELQPAPMLPPGAPPPGAQPAA